MSVCARLRRLRRCVCAWCTKSAAHQHGGGIPAEHLAWPRERVPSRRYVADDDNGEYPASTHSWNRSSLALGVCSEAGEMSPAPATYKAADAPRRAGRERVRLSTHRPVAFHLPSGVRDAHGLCGVRAEE